MYRITVGPEVSWHFSALGGGGNVDMTVMHGRFCPVGSVQDGNVRVVATLAEATEPPLTINVTNARIKTVVSFLSVLIC